MARRRGRRKGRRGKSAIPLLPVIAAGAPLIKSLMEVTLDANGMKYLPYNIAYNYTGHDFKSGSGTNWTIPVTNLIGVVIGVAGHKIANKAGVNKYIRKATFGWVSL